MEEDEWMAFAGVLKGAKYPDGMTVASVLYILEHGTDDGKIPPRPILRYVVANFMPKWKKQFAKLLMRGMDAKTALKQLGEIMAGDIRETMSKATGLFEDNSELTQKLKAWDPGRTKGWPGKGDQEAFESAGKVNAPFRWTGYLLGSISHEIRKGKKKGMS